MNSYKPQASVNLLGRKVNILDLSHEISPDMPIYPGHAKVAFWSHLSHDEVRHSRIHPESEFEGYAVKGITMCDHVSTHIDAIYHFNKQRPELTIDQMPFENLVSPAVWIDVSDVPPRTHITLERIHKALADAKATLKEGSTLLIYTGAEKNFYDPLTFNSQYPGLDSEATNWILDQGVINVCTDAPSTDNPADTRYPNHLAHGKRCVPHTELVANISKIPTQKDFWVMIMPLKFKGLTGSPVRAVALWPEE